MSKRYDSFLKKLAPFMAAGMLLQVGTCNSQVAEVGAGLVGTVFTQLLTTIVYSAFGLV